MASVADMFEQALKHHREGRFKEANVLYGQVLRAEPQHADAWHLLGVLSGQLGARTSV